MGAEKLNYMIRGTPLIKFQSADRIEQLRQGHLYAKTLSYYRQCEKETGDVDIGDEFEAMLHVNQGQMINKKTGEAVTLDDSLISTSSSDDFVFCMFGIYPSLDSFEFSDKQKERMLSFGDTALLILDSDAFINRVLRVATALGYEYHFEAVQYFDPQVDYANIWISLMRGMWNIAFWKRESYRYQQEGRFVFTPNKSGADHIDLDIGNISDISEVIPSARVIKAIVNRKR